MNPALLSAFNPLSYACECCGKARGVACRELHLTGLIQLTCPERVRAAQHYGMKLWDEQKLFVRTPVIELQPSGAA